MVSPLPLTGQRVVGGSTWRRRTPCNEFHRVRWSLQSADRVWLEGRPSHRAIWPNTHHRGRSTQVGHGRGDSRQLGYYGADALCHTQRHSRSTPARDRAAAGLRSTVPPKIPSLKAVRSRLDPPWSQGGSISLRSLLIRSQLLCRKRCRHDHMSVIRRATLLACQEPPRGAGTPRRFSSAATARSDMIPAARSSASRGAIRSARSAACRRLPAAAWAPSCAVSR